MYGDILETGIDHEFGGALGAAGGAAIDRDRQMLGIGDLTQHRRHMGEGQIACARDMALLSAELIRIAHIDNKAADLPVTTEDRDGKFDVPAKESLQA